MKKFFIYFSLLVSGFCFSAEHAEKSLGYDVNGNISISPGTSKVIAGLLQENIILGDHIHIQAKPMLNISSNDVQASHGAKIERIDSEKLLYMTSRGLTPQQAQRLVIQWYFAHIHDQMSWGMQEKEVKELGTLLDTLQQKVFW